jgi:hypothetical protein
MKQSKFCWAVAFIFLIAFLSGCSVVQSKGQSSSNDLDVLEKKSSGNHGSHTFVFVWAAQLYGTGLPEKAIEDIQLWKDTEAIESACVTYESDAFPEMVPEELLLFDSDDVNPSNLAYPQGTAKPLLDTLKVSLSSSGENLSIENYSRSHGQGVLSFFCAREWKPSHQLPDFVTVMTSLDSDVEWVLDITNSDEYILLWPEYSDTRETWEDLGYEYPRIS